MGVLRGALGAVVGAAVAGVALRARQVSRDRDESIVDALAELPEVLQEDCARIADAARAAVADGRRAAIRREREIEEALARPRPSEGIQ